jgi:hypothetical protein
MPAALAKLNATATKEGSNVMVTKAVDAIRTAWPVAGIGLAVAVNGVWIAALGYGISKFFNRPS